MLGSFLLLLWVFLTAYLNDGFSTTVNVNKYGEAHVEMIILIIFLLPLFILTTALSFLDWRQTWKSKSMVSSQKIILSDGPPFYQEFMEEITCPRCRYNFMVKMSNFGVYVQCPSCGLEGKYMPDVHETQTGGMGKKPEVRVIKDIRH
jgi:hypothetical protein